jgi:hypothetical protein
MRRWSLPVVAVLAAMSLGGLASTLHAQGSWDAILTIQPFPSPYFSDWDTNPNIGSLTVMNHTASAEDVRIFFTITDGLNRVIAQGTSDPDRIGPGAVAIYDSPYEIAGSGSHDAEIERIASRTGRLPEGDYTACASAADASGFVLAEACADFFITYPDPPLLLAPDPAAVLTEEAPLFQWTPVQVPTEYQLTYALRVVEVLEGQLPGEALATNIPVHEERDAFSTTFRYPIDARPLEPGRTYAWSVRALDQNGYAASANEGRSEIWTFAVEDPNAPPPVESGLRLRLTNARSAVSEIATGLGTMCGALTSADSTAPTEITLPMQVPMVLREGTIFEGSATLYWEPKTLGWAVLARADRLSYLLYGECGSGIAALGGLQWVATRVSGNLGNLTDGLELEPTPATELPLRFGVLIVALGPATTALPDGFDQAREFLNFREIDLRLGVNLFAMVDVLRDTDDLPIGTFLEWAGYPDRYVEVQGYAGVDGSWSIGGSTGSAAAAVGEVSRTRTLLSLRASLPARKARLFPDYFESAQVGLLFEVADSTGIQAGTGARTQTNRDLIFSGTIDLTAREGKFGPGSRWYGSFGYQVTSSQIDTAAARPRALLPGAGSDTTVYSGKWVLKVGVDQLQFLAGRGLLRQAYLSGLQLEIDLANLREAILEKDRRALSLDAIGTATIGVGEFDDLGRVTIGIGRSGDEVRAAATTAAVADQPPPRPMGPQTREEAATQAEGGDGPRPRMNAVELNRDGDPRSAEGQADRTSAPHLAENAETAPGAIRWGVRVAVGNMSLGELLKLIRQGGVGDPPGQDAEGDSDG